MSEGLASKIKAVARREGVWDSDLVSFLLRDGLARLEAGDLEIPKRPAGRPFRIAEIPDEQT